MSEREREQFEVQMRERNSFVVFSCGCGGLEVSRANFFLEVESFQAFGTLSQAKSKTAIPSNRTTASVMMRARGCPQDSLRQSPTKPRRTADTTKRISRSTLLLTLYQIGRELKGRRIACRYDRGKPYNWVACRRSAIFCKNSSTSSGFFSQ